MKTCAATASPSLLKLDLEMSFVQRDDVLEVVEGCSRQW